MLNKVLPGAFITAWASKCASGLQLVIATDYLMSCTLIALAFIL
jgi:hypothetical protein